MHTTTEKEELRRTATARSIKARWAKIANNSDTATVPAGIGAMYSGSSITNTTADFLGDWRSADSWMRFDLFRVRARSRQLARGNPWVRNYLRVLRSNVLGALGFHFKCMACGVPSAGDTTLSLDKVANTLIKDGMDKQGKSENFTTRKRMSRKEVDQLLMSRLPIDGEFVAIKRAGFANECGFAWQIIDPDYLDHNLNRVESNGNITRMGIELDRTDKFPVAYHFLKRRPSDSYYGNEAVHPDRYTRVEAKDVIHIFVQDEDAEQTRGFPWIFAAVVNLFRMGKFEEAALVNATIGASKGVYYKKDYPTGWIEAGNELDQNGALIDKVEAGMAEELPMGVTPMTLDMRYPDGEIQPFLNAMQLGNAAALGISYASATGDLAQANYVSSRLGQMEEREYFMYLQEFIIEKWKKPGFKEELWRGLVIQAITLPITKFEKFNRPRFTGRRWPFVQPVDELKAKQMALDMCLTSQSQIIEEMPGDEEPEEIFAAIAKDNDAMRLLGIGRVNGDGTVQGQPSIREQMEAYGIAVRAGVFTPNLADENFMRAKVGLPPVTKEVKGAWNEDGGTRKPITLQGQAAALETAGLTAEGNAKGEKGKKGIDGERGSDTSGET